MPPYEVRGALHLQGRIAHGWCQSPQRPGESLRIEILADGRAVARVIAGRLHLPLVRPGVSDGYHGFSIPLPETALGDLMLEAREVETGQVFARLLPAAPSDIAAWQAQARSLGESLATAEAGMPETMVAARRLRQAFAQVGAFLTRERATPLALRAVATPRLSIILDLPRGRAGPADAAAAGQARATIAAFAPLLSTLSAELIAIDDGSLADRLSAIAGLRLCIAREAAAAARLNRAIGLAAAPAVACFAPAAPVSPADLARLLATEEEAILLGGGVARAVRGAGLTTLAERIVPQRGATGLLLRAPRTAFARAGMLDPAFEDGADLPIAAWAFAGDFGEVTILDEPRAGLPQTLPAARVQAARAHFLAALPGHTARPIS